MWFPLSIAALLAWSGSDLFSKIGSRPDDKYSHWKMVMAVGLVMGLHALFEIFVSGVRVTPQDLLRYAPASGLYILSMILGYVGLRYIELSVSSPICNSSGAIAAILCFIFLGQRLNAWQTVAVFLVCGGVIALGIVEAKEDPELRAQRQEKANVKYARSVLAILLPVLYCLLDAAGTFADSLVLETLNEDSANVAYELTFLAAGVVCLIYLLARREKFFVRQEAPKYVAACFETVGQLFYIYALADEEHVALSAPIISAYCVASVLWSRLFLREKLSWKHYAMILLVVAGIVILGVYDI